MYFFKFFYVCLSISLYAYYAYVICHLLDIIKITNKKITWKAIIPFYYFFK